MMDAPTRYYVEWLDDEKFAAEQQALAGNADPRRFTHDENFDTLKAARAFKAKKAQRTWAAIYERSNIYDTTPLELRDLGVTWYSASFDEDLIED